MAGAQTDRSVPTPPYEATFLSYSRDDAAFAIPLAEGLRTRGVRLWVDLWNIAAGSDWDRAIDRALSQCARFLIVLSPSAVTSDEVRGELRSALNARKPIVPVLFRPCEIPRQLQNIQFVDFTDDSAAHDGQLEELARVLGGERSADEPSPPPFDMRMEPPGQTQTAYRTRRDLRNRSTVLKDVQSEVTGRLARSVPDQAAITIAIEWQPDRVHPPWVLDLKMPRPAPAAPPPSDIVDAFDAPMTAGRLLILGGPGSGKTTAMLLLAKELIARAERDFSEPVPVLFNLSSWRGPRTTLGDWIVGELKHKYGVREDLSTQWRDEGGLVPLLDGLDELPSAHQDACVRAINEFQQAYRRPGLLVCCRFDEYANLASTLRLNNAVRLISLSDPQIRDYLVRIGQPLVWERIRGEAASLELARSPLLLSLIASVGEHDAGKEPVTGAPATATSRLFQSYVEAMLMRDDPTGRYAREDARHWLSQLASVLGRQRQSDFLLEGMQPSWLHSRGQRWSYRIGLTLATAAIVVGIDALATSFTDRLPRGSLGTVLHAAFGVSPLADAAMRLAMGLVLGVLIASRTAIVPVETVTWSWKRARGGAAHWARTSLRNGLDYGFAAGAAVGAALVALDVSGLWPIFRAAPTSPAAATVWHRIGVFLGMVCSVLGAIGMSAIKPSAWMKPALLPALPQVINAGVGAAAVGVLVTETGNGLPMNAIAMLMFALLLGSSRAFTSASRLTCVNALIVGAVSAPVAAWIALMVGRFPSGFARWLMIFSLIGLACSLVAGLGSVVWTRLPGRADSAPSGDRPNDHSMNVLVRAWSRSAVLGAAVGVACGIIAVVVSGLGHQWLLRSLALLALPIAWIGFAALVGAFVVGTGFAVAAASGGTVLGALAGTLSGITGPDVERRRLPNQGIRQSAANVPTFAVIGMLAVGIPFAIFNISTGAIGLRTWPSGADWLRIGFHNVLLFGILAGLIPGAACLQHYTLRFVLWWTRAAPWRYADFLDFATDRMLLQRVGGRYRFVHVLLRDHLARQDTAAATPAPAEIT